MKSTLPRFRFGSVSSWMTSLINLPSGTTL
nr:MAG TPA: hypothetical protein [Caudoviricetes sp.]